MNLGLNYVTRKVSINNKNLWFEFKFMNVQLTIFQIHAEIIGVYLF